MSCPHKHCARESSLTFLGAIGFAILATLTPGGWGTVYRVICLLWIVLAAVERYAENREERSGR